MKRLLFIVLLFVSSLRFFSQEGNHYLTNFTPSNYGASDQNWNILQDSLGHLFVANLNGIMIYDGKYWKTVNMAHEASCISLAKSKTGVIYAGGSEEFGYISTTSDSGKIKYNSLSNSLPENEKEFGNIWAIHSIGKTQYFCSNKKIFCFENNELKYIHKPSGEKFHTFFNIKNTLLVREQGVGFSYLKDGKLKKILGSGDFADIRVYAIVPYKEDLFWVCSRNGLYSLSFNEHRPEISAISKVNSTVDDWLINNEIYCGTKVSENFYALGSVKNGMLLLDKNFNPVTHLYSQNGLQDDNIKFIYSDFSGNIWVALHKGLSFIELNTPLTHWTKSDGIHGVIESVAKWNNALYIATDKGVEKLNPLTNTFETTEINEEGWGLLNFNDVLLAATNQSLYEISKSGIKRVYEKPDGVFKVFKDNYNKDIIYLSGQSTLAIGKYKNHTFTLIKEFDNAPDVRSSASGKNGRVFFASRTNGIFMYDPNFPDSLFNYTNLDGLPEPLDEIYVFNYNNEVLVATEGIYTYKEGRKPLFIKENKYNVFSKKTQVAKAIQINNDIWMASNHNGEDNRKIDELSVLRFADGKFVQDYKLLKRVRELSGKCFLIDSNKVFIGTNDGLIEYNNKFNNQGYGFNTFISKVFQRVDSNVIIQNLYPGFVHPEFSFEFKNNDISFVAAASDYFDKNELEFSYFLDGLEENYGDWTKNNKITYNKLHEGHYEFFLKSRNILGKEGAVISFDFTILPPWYRTYWAYALYLLGSIGLIWFIVAYNTRRLKEQNINLEKIITERTKEIEHQKEEIEHKNQEITDSINYAKRIQQAILPPVAEIIKIWKDLFVFYQPKDIVSGDFYWFHKISNDEILIACADCTGHGVPGGFMSMICSDKLNDAVKETHDPAKILFYVNNNVKKALRQNETSDENVNKDGMEISLVRIDFKNQKVWYAGANRPLWLLKKGAEEIEEIKPTKASIASFTQTDFEYQGHELQLEKDDLVYLTSDGYPDQFGGVDGKKFMTKNFKKLILSIKQLGIREQETTVKNVINQWKEGYEQVDDLLVIAFKL